VDEQNPEQAGATFRAKGDGSLMCGPRVARNTHTNVAIPTVVIYFQRFPGTGRTVEQHSVGRFRFACYLAWENGRRKLYSRTRLNSDGSVEVSFPLRRVELRVGGEWTNLYRAVDGRGASVEFYLSRTRDLGAAKLFLRKAMADQTPHTRRYAPRGD
jgi:transposase-like protein